MSKKDLFLARFGTDKNISKTLDTVGDQDVKIAALSNPLVKPHHLDKALEDRNWYVRDAAAASSAATSEHIHKALNDKESYVRESAAKNANATSEHIDKALNDEDSNVRQVAISNPNTTPSQLMSILKNGSERDTNIAAYSPNIGKEHVDYISSHPNKVGQIAMNRAMDSEHVSQDGLLNGLKHNKKSGEFALSNSKIQKETIIKSLSNLHPDLVHLALNHRTMDKETINSLTMHSSPLVALEAVRHKLVSKEATNNAIANHPNVPLRDALKIMSK